MISHKKNNKEELREANLKVTPARLGVLTALKKTNLPVDVPDIIESLNKNHIEANRTTVFRIINVLTKKGLAMPIQFNDGKLRYEYTKKPKHHHFVCEYCGIVEDIEGCTVNSLEKDLQKKRGFMITYHSLEFFGMCVKCQL